MALFAAVAELAEELAGEPGRLKKRAAIEEAIRRVHESAPNSEDAGRFADAVQLLGCLLNDGAKFAAIAEATPAQIVFSFARAVGMLPLTGTSDAEHMKQDLASRGLTLPPEAVQTIDSLAG